MASNALISLFVGMWSMVTQSKLEKGDGLLKKCSESV